MKKYVAVLIAIAMVGSLIPLVGADNTATVTLTFNNDASANITIDPTTWNPSVGVGGLSVNKTDFYLNNTGTARVDVEVKCSNASNAWVIGSDAGHDTFKMEANVDGGAWTTLDVTDTSGYVTDLLPGSETVGLQYTSPTSSSDAEASPTATVTFTATVG